VDDTKIKVLFNKDTEGYIVGYQKAFWNGTEWETPFDTTNAIEVSNDSLKDIYIGASKVDALGNITTDADKKAELEKKEQSILSPEDKLASLQQSNDELQSALLELSDLVLSGGGSK